jgi:hypothetical protein
MANEDQNSYQRRHDEHTDKSPRSEDMGAQELQALALEKWLWVRFDLILGESCQAWSYLRGVE